jgi:hypothetical protein
MHGLRRQIANYDRDMAVRRAQNTIGVNPSPTVGATELVTREGVR